MTTEAKHTPGPWIVCTMDDSDNALSIEQDRLARGDEEPSIVAEVDLCGDGIDRTTGEANARLIAAAPDLLAACEESLRVLTLESVTDRLYTQPGMEQGYEAIDILRAAIAKATGKD